MNARFGALFTPLIILSFVAALGSTLSGCASVQTEKIYLKEPYRINVCSVYGIRANFPGWPEKGNIPIKLGAEIAEALKKLKIAASFSEATEKEVGAVLSAPSVASATVIVVSGDGIVVERGSYGSNANGISFCNVRIYDQTGHQLIAEYKLRIATGLSNFKSEAGGFKDCARDFVQGSVTSDHMLAKAK